MDGLGSITWWGFSPCIHLLCSDDPKSVPEGLDSVGCNSGTINILLVGSGDLRHWLKTMAGLRRSHTAAINFYIIENSIEVYARHTLFLALVLEAPQSRGLQEKTELFLEIFGNILVRYHTEQYIQAIANELIKMVTNVDYLNEKLPILDITQLKFKERDMLETIFKFWKQPQKSFFDASKCWDLRLRHYLGVRYDARKGVFDWDYSMKLCERGAEIIGSRTYCNWRSTGVAFGLREGTYDSPNKTLSSAAVFQHEGERTARRGYWGDIVISPYIAFGVESKEKGFYTKTNNELTKTSEDVSQHNLLSLLYELQTGKPYTKEASVADTQSPEETSSRCDQTEGEGEADESAPSEERQPFNYTSFPIENVKVILLPLNALAEMSNRSKYQKLFNVVCISSSMAHCLTTSLTETFADNAVIYLEKAKYLIELNAKQCEEFDARISAIASEVGCSPLSTSAESGSYFARFQYSQRGATDA